MAGSGALGVSGLAVGHWTGGATGVTVLVCPDGSVGAADVRGGAPATRELALLEVTKTVARVDAVVLTGGSAFGLRAADGVMEALARRGKGYPTAAGVVPIVPAAALFDLLGSDGEIPSAANGASATEGATDNEAVARGRVGAGRGATVGKWRGGEHRCDGGFGAAAVDVEAVRLGAFAAVNAFGDVVDDRGEVIAGSTAPLDAPAFPDEDPFDARDRENTTLVVVVTNARLGKVDCRVLAEAAHDGFARALRPSHTRADGDIAFAVATGAHEASFDRLHAAVPDVVAAAIRDAVTD